jgi:hypothetical protein
MNKLQKIVNHVQHDLPEPFDTLINASKQAGESINEVSKSLRNINSDGKFINKEHLKNRLKHKAEARHRERLNRKKARRLK